LGAVGLKVKGAILSKYGKSTVVEYKLEAVMITIYERWSMRTVG
jgi:hypothetical protein